MNLLLLCFFIAGPSLAATLNSEIPEQKIKLEDFLKRVKSSDPQMQSIIADRLKMKYLTDLNLPSRQILLRVQNEYGFTRDQEPTKVLSATLSKPILESGTVVSISKTMTERPDRSEDVTQMRIEQSLYKNAFGSEVRERIENLEEQKSVVELQVIEAYEDYMANAMTKYLDLTLAYLSYQTSQRLRKESETLLGNVQKKLQQNIASGTDFKRAKLQKAQRSENELQSKINMESLSSGILAILGEPQNSILLPETVLNIEERLTNADIDMERFLRVSRSKLIYDKQENINKKNLELVRENLRPAANLLVGFNIDNSTRFATTINREEGVIGINVDIPFDSSVVNAQIKEASYILLKSKLEKKTFENAIRESIVLIKNRIIRQRELLKISKEKRDLASDIVKEQTRRYQVGRVTLESLIEDRNNEAQSEFTYLTELINLNKLIVQWLALTDQLVSKMDLAKLN